MLLQYNVVIFYKSVEIDESYKSFCQNPAIYIFLGTIGKMMSNECNKYKSGADSQIQIELTENTWPTLLVSVMVNTRNEVQDVDIDFIA